MKVSSFIFGGIAGGICYFLLDWFFYDILFMDYFAISRPMELVEIFGGCMAYGFLYAYLFVLFSNVQTFSKGMQGGSAIGGLIALWNNFFTWAALPETHIEKFCFDVALGFLMGALVGGVVGLVNRLAAPKIKGAVY